MPLFQHSVLKKYLGELDNDALNAAWQRFQNHFHNAAIQQNILNAKEEEYQEGFVRDLFVNVLGYTLKPQPDYNLVLEQKSTSDATKSDGAILSPEGNVVAVIELKDTTTTDLGKVERQAFGYKHQHKDCRYVIISNFIQLRLYINDAIEYEAFDLFQLDKNSFALLYCCLQQKALHHEVPLKMKQQSVAVEENITKKLYDDYSRFKKLLFENITQQNAAYDRLILFKKTQKLLDRFLFILFAEDRGLLPPNSVRDILGQWDQLKDLDNYVPLYARFQKYFGYLNTGHKGKQHEIFAYNGGLFMPDDILDNIIIDDQLLYESCKGLSNYDFESEVDVNILGHIFEHSLNEIEEIEQQLSSPLGGGREGASKRKKDGVFYTPRYITKYIVENTLGALCTQKRNELNIIDEDFAPQKRKANKKHLSEKLEDYRDWLLDLTICDPACGSGAFLNQALEFLIAEHQSIDVLKAKLFGDALVFRDVENSILEYNLYGVDINEEATDIAKLSLWLRTARKGRKLNNLSQHIKCGNSLIDDPTVAGAKAFNWEKEFPEVFGDKRKRFFAILNDYREKVANYKTTPEQLDAIFQKMDKKGFAQIEMEWGAPLTSVRDFVEAALTLVPDERPPMMWMLFMGDDDETVALLKELSENNGIPLEDIHEVIMEKFLEDVEVNFDEYSDGFSSGFTRGFDVVIGNPPYVRQELLGAKMKNYFSKKFKKVYNGIADLYVYFFEKGLGILNANGKLGFITPNKWMERKYGNETRKFLLPFHIEQIINFGELRIFEDASTEPSITIIKNEVSNDDIEYSMIKSLEEARQGQYFKQCFRKNELNEDIWRFSNTIINTILTKFNNSEITLSEYTRSGVYRGILTGSNKVFIISQEKANELILKDPKSIDLLKKMVEGDDFGKWYLNYSGRYILNTGYNVDVPNSYKAVYAYLKEFEKNLIKRSDKGKNYWNLRACDYYHKFGSPKIIYYHTAVKHNFYFDTEGYFLSSNCYMIANGDTYLQCVLNSSLFAFVKRYLFPAFGDAEERGRVRLDANKMVKLRIKVISEKEKQNYATKADIMLCKNKELQQVKQSLLQLLQSKYEGITFSKKLQDWPALSFKAFLKELDKQKIKLSLPAQAEWMTYFETEKPKPMLFSKSSIKQIKK